MTKGMKPTRQMLQKPSCMQQRAKIPDTTAPYASATQWILAIECRAALATIAAQKVTQIDNARETRSIHATQAAVQCGGHAKESVIPLG